ncbi:MAG TPA: hypothetical protein VLB80_03125 [Candidatus Babeliales bacterium]|nr:hypothetical protein [Candidatus Babeliales bacterium]
MKYYSAICFVLLLYASTIHAMDISSYTEYEYNDFTLATKWLPYYENMLMHQAIQIISDEYIQKKYPYLHKVTDQQYKANVKKGIVKEKGLCTLYGLDEKDLSKKIAQWWDKGIESYDYAVTVTDLVSSLSAQQKSVYVNISNQERYTLSQLFDVVIPLIIQSNNLSASVEKYKKNIAHILTRYFMISYALPQENQIVKWCNCSKVSFGERITMIITIAEKVLEKHSNKITNANDPLIYTSFGSGWLLQDYLTLSLLNTLGFNYFRARFIDTYYGEKYDNKSRFTKVLSQLWKDHNTGIVNIDFFHIIADYLAEYNKLSQKNNVLTTVDASELNPLDSADCLKATYVELVFENKYYNLMEKIVINFYDQNEPDLSPVHGKLNISPQKAKSNIMQTQIELALKTITTNIDAKTSVGKMSVKDIVDIVFGVQKNLEEYTQAMTQNQKKDAYNHYTMWKRSSQRDFQELVKVTSDENSCVTSCNAHRLVIYKVNQ